MLSQVKEYLGRKKELESEISRETIKVQEYLVSLAPNSLAKFFEEESWILLHVLEEGSYEHDFYRTDLESYGLPDFFELKMELQKLEMIWEHSISFKFRETIIGRDFALLITFKLNKGG